eukprot:311613-Rhodomonas_salina.1
MREGDLAKKGVGEVGVLGGEASVVEVGEREVGALRQRARQPRHLLRRVTRERCQKAASRP